MTTMLRRVVLCSILGATPLVVVPEEARAENDLTIEQVKEGLYAIIGSGGNVGVRVTSEGVILIDDKGPPRIVAEGIGFANENKVDPSGQWLYVHETMGRSICRFAINADNSVGPRETAADYGVGIFPDGFEFDSEGGIWCTSVVSNRIVRIAPNGSQHIVFDGGDQDVTDRAEEAYQNDSYTRAHLVDGHASILGNCASICFGGPDLKTCFIGSLASDRVASFRSPVAGAVPPHWKF